MAKVGVLGAGSWGTALSVLLHDNGHQVTIWSIDGNEVKMLDEKREHELKLPGVKLAEDMVITGDLETAVRGKDFLVLAVPSPFTRETARKMEPYVADGQIIVDVAKGIEESTLMTLSRQIEEEIPQADVAVLSGPSHADDVCDRREDTENCRVSPVHVYQPCVPRVYKPRYPRDRARRIPEKCDRSGSRHR